MQGRLVIVTGGARGVGAGITRSFLEAGADVVVIGRSAPETPVSSGSREAAFQAADVRDPEQGSAAFAAIHASYGRIDVLVNNAGIRAPYNFGDYTRAQFDAVVGVNIATPFFASQAVVPIMRAQGGGRIIHIASQLGHVTYAKRALYGLTKAALLHLTKSMAYELGKDNIQVNSVSPGPIKTQPLIDRLRTEPEEMARRVSQYVPLGRLGEPGEIADVAFFLATDAPAFLQGEDICVDGGYINH